MGLARHFLSPGGRQEVNSTWYPEIEEPIESREKHYSLVLYILMHHITNVWPIWISRERPARQGAGCFPSSSGLDQCGTLLELFNSYQYCIILPTLNQYVFVGFRPFLTCKTRRRSYWKSCRARFVSLSATLYWRTIPPAQPKPRRRSPA